MINKPYPWFRVYSELIRDTKLKHFASDMQYDMPFAWGIWAGILCLANESPIRGKLYITENVTMNIEDLGDFLYCVNDIGHIMESLQNLGMVYLDENGAWCISNWDARQYITSSAERTREWRKKKKNGDVTVTSQSVTCDTDCDTDCDADCDAAVTDDSVICGMRYVNNKESLNTPIFQIYEREIGMLTPMIACELAEAEKEYPPNWLEPAFQEAVRANARNWRYVQAILKRWKVDGFQSRKNKDGQIVQGPMTLDEEIQLALKRDGLA